MGVIRPAHLPALKLEPQGWFVSSEWLNLVPFGFLLPATSLFSGEPDALGRPSLTLEFLPSSHPRGSVLQLCVVRQTLSPPPKPRLQRLTRQRTLSQGNPCLCISGKAVSLRTV